MSGIGNQCKGAGYQTTNNLRHHKTASKPHGDKNATLVVPTHLGCVMMSTVLMLVVRMCVLFDQALSGNASKGHIDHREDASDLNRE
jgi:hypothetical protein